MRTNKKNDDTFKNSAIHDLSKSLDFKKKKIQDIRIITTRKGVLRIRKNEYLHLEIWIQHWPL